MRSRTLNAELVVAADGGSSDIRKTILSFGPASSVLWLPHGARHDSRNENSEETRAIIRPGKG
jgi:2-polyprenyl-6-methoxyphenol hydroxylase-like FAD-dependent oxidoreductase